MDAPVERGEPAEARVPCTLPADTALPTNDLAARTNEQTAFASVSKTFAKEGGSLAEEHHTRQCTGTPKEELVATLDEATPASQLPRLARPIAAAVQSEHVTPGSVMAVHKVYQKEEPRELNSEPSAPLLGSEAMNADDGRVAPALPPLSTPLQAGHSYGEAKASHLQSAHVGAAPSSELASDLRLETNAFLAVRRAYSRDQLRALRHQRMYPLPSDDPVRVTPAPAILPDAPPPRGDPEARTSDVILIGADNALTFVDLSLPPPLVKALSSGGFDRPSPVQLASLPSSRLGVDVIAQAKSGTGKTLAFCIAAAEVAAAAPRTGPAVLLLAPARELAEQIATSLGPLVEALRPGARVATLIGGASEYADAERLAKSTPVAVVGTPGRIVALLGNNMLRGDKLELLVLDEADRLLDGSLGDAVPRICALLSERVQTLAFSATFPDNLRRLLGRVMRNPVHVRIESDGRQAVSREVSLRNEGSDGNRRAALLGVNQRRIRVARGGAMKKARDPDGKPDRLALLLKSTEFNFGIVFTNNKNMGRLSSARLAAEGYSCEVFNAEIRQTQRALVMQSVRKGKVQVLVTTDLLARGVDFHLCDLVVHLDVPLDPTTYLHRVGRAGRYGKRGLSVIIHFDGEEAAHMSCLEKMLGFQIQQMSISAGPKLGKRRRSPATSKTPLQDHQQELGLSSTRAVKQMNTDWDHDASQETSPKVAALVVKDASAGHGESARGSEKNDDAEIQDWGGDLKQRVVKDLGNAHICSMNNGNPTGVSVEAAPHLFPIPSVNSEPSPWGGWDDFAQRSYSEGYKDAYARAFRLGRAAAGRLGDLS